MKPNWKLLKNYNIWVEAFVQIFYSLGPGWGGLITMASYNRFRNYCLRESLLVPLINSATSIYGGIAVFSTLGFLSEKLNQDITEVVKSGPNLVFIAYPEAMVHLPAPPVWSVLFFFTMLLLGLDSQFTMIETVVTAVYDELPKKYRRNKTWVTLVVCIVFCLIGLVFTLESGFYIYAFVEWYIAYFAVLVICIFEAVVVSYVYGVRKFFNDIEFMVNRVVYGKYVWYGLWAVVVPILLMIIVILGIIFHVPVYLGDYHYPEWAISVGWFLATWAVLPIPLFAIYYLIKQGFFQGLRRGLRASDDWGPAVDSYFWEYQSFKESHGYRYKRRNDVTPLQLHEPWTGERVKENELREVEMGKTNYAFDGRS